MGYEPLVKQNPLRALKTGKENGKEMGLVMARAGLGKTALLVQIALDSILLGNRVVHVSVGQSIDKTRAWYDDILRHILQDHSVDHPHELIDMVQRHRMIMTFKEAALNRPRLEERLNDLIMQDIFKPNCLVIDGFDFEAMDRATLEDIRDMAEAMSLQIQSHILISLFAYGLLTVGAIVAIYALAQDMRLRAGLLSSVNQLFAPLETTERLLFGITSAGFLFLLVAVSSGFAFVENLFAQHLVHKTALSLLALVLFGLLLAGRRFAGWRGRRAIYLYLWGFLILCLAYFGTRYILEEVLGRSWS